MKKDQRHGKKQTSNKKTKNATRNKKKPKQQAENGDGSGMDDILEQLRRQREKRHQAKAKETPVEDTTRQSEDSNENTSNDAANGDFRYDPILKRYLPKSAYNSNGNNDVCIQRIQEQKQRNTPTVFHQEVSGNTQFFEPRGTVADADIRNVVFRGTCLPSRSAIGNSEPSKSGKKRKKRYNNSADNLQSHQKENYSRSQNKSITCSSKSSLLLATSLEYCTNTSRRISIASMLGPMSVAGRAKVIPTQTTFFQGNRTVPYDSSKSYLHPAASTFDILPCRGGWRSPDMPHLATISNDRVHYLSPYGIRGSAWELKSFSKKPLQHYGLRFAPYCAPDGLDEDAFVGCIVYDAKTGQRAFTLRNTGKHTNQWAGESCRVTVPSPVNDFCFAPGGTLQAPGSVAFAHNGEGGIGTSLLDLSTKSYTDTRDSWSKSELMCLQFRRKNNIIFGHRDGSVSMIDTRSVDKLFATNHGIAGASFGSVSSIQPLQNENLVMAKGSFGSCRVLDLRRLSNSFDGSSSPSQQSTLLELNIPDCMVHPTKSTRCTGLAIDPTESIAIAPFAGHNNDVRFAIWDISSGALIRTKDVGKRKISEAGSNDSLSSFCELSSGVTSGYEMVCKKDSQLFVKANEGSAFGLWFKTNVLSDSSSPDGVGIHHLRF